MNQSSGLKVGFCLIQLWKKESMQGYVTFENITSGF